MVRERAGARLCLYVHDTHKRKIRGKYRGVESASSAIKASFNFPTGIAVAKNGDLYVADSGNNAIRKITSAPR